MEPTWTPAYLAKLAKGGAHPCGEAIAQGEKIILRPTLNETLVLHVDCAAKGRPPLMTTDARGSAKWPMVCGWTMTEALKRQPKGKS